MQGIEEGRGFVRAMWCGETECEEAIKEKNRRNDPLRAV